MLKQLICWLWNGHKKKITREIKVYEDVDLEQGFLRVEFDYICTLCGYVGNTRKKPE